MNQSSTYRFTIRVPKQVPLGDGTVSRDDFYGWVWERFSEEGLLGVHEGTLLTPDAAREGLETESWTVDAGEAPRERDWVAGQALGSAELYFASREQAEEAARVLREENSIETGEIEEQPYQDWDAEWKASFEGAFVPPFWRVVPPWKEDSKGPSEVLLKINPGAGFGTGTHETTQLCLEAIADCARKSPIQGKRVLDFGSGSGILAIGAALLGAEVDAVEIDPLAIENAEENARLNSVEGRISYSKTLGGASGPYPMVIANILRPVLLEFASQLVSRMDPKGGLILSGLIATDVEPVSSAFTPLVGAGAPEVRELGEWRCLVWRR